MRIINGDDLLEHASVNCEDSGFIRKLSDYIDEAPVLDIPERLKEAGCMTCLYCYYEAFDERAYPCSMCIRGEERTDKFQPKTRL